MTLPVTQPHFILVAGETSGDNLGAQLIEALREQVPHARFSGIAGPRMRAAGCEAWERAEDFAVMGLLEVLPELPRLMWIRRRLVKRVLAERPLVYIGVDFKEFNLNVARRIKRAGIRTVQYVSPQVWAWRQGRVRKIAQAVDQVLCVLPFEKKFYDSQPRERQVDARFVGHPLADRIPLESEQRDARAAFGLALDTQCIALLPGSRRSEVARLSADFAATVAWLLERRHALHFIAPMAGADVKEIFAASLARSGVARHVTLIDGRSQEVLAACDAALVASGTASLEALLVKRPMVVVYRADPMTTFLFGVLQLMKAPFFALPNLLAGRQLVPEFLNRQVRAEVLGPALLAQLDRADRKALLDVFAEIHRALKRDASRESARAILDLTKSAT